MKCFRTASGSAKFYFTVFIVLIMAMLSFVGLLGRYNASEVYFIKKAQNTKKQSIVGITVGTLQKGIGVSSLKQFSNFSQIHEDVHRQPIKERSSTKIDNQAQRLSRIHSVCQSRKHQTYEMHGIHYDQKTKLAYCYLPKSGCTYWKRIFMLISNMDKNGNIPKGDTSLSMDRNSVHVYPKIIKNPSDDFFKKSINFMFVRDPYSRLWSAYLDKFFLSNFWGTIGLLIVREENNKRQCAHDITFKKFIEYVISENVMEANEHWKPMTYLCDPCIFSPQFVGKMESFSEDRDSFLKSVGQQKVLDYLSKQPNMKRREISMLVQNYYQTYKHWNNCISQSDYNQRIWTLLQLNGYIPLNISFNPIIPRNESEMIRHINTILDSTPLDKLALKQQKKQSMIDAFKSLPNQYLKRLSEYYQQDFEMFGYDPKPKELF